MTSSPLVKEVASDKELELKKKKKPHLIKDNSFPGCDMLQRYKRVPLGETEGRIHRILMNYFLQCM